MAPLSAWLPARSSQDFDLVVKIVGNGAAGLIEEFATIGQALTDQGLEVMTQTGRSHGESGELTFLLRLASSPFYSMGHGYNILVYLGDQIPLFQEFGLQRGSVVVWEPPEQHRLQPVMPEGVTAYPVPFKKLIAQNGDGIAARGFVAMGVLFHLLGLPERSLRIHRMSLSARRSIDAGFQFARRALVKRDIYALPLAEPSQSRILLNPHRAVMLGFAAGHCGCTVNCDEELKRSPTEWVTEHLAVADRMVSLLHSDMHPGACAYRGPRGEVFALLRGNDSAIQSYVKGHSDPRIFVAADVPDALQLLVGGHRLIRNGLANVVGVMIEDGLAARHQSVEVNRLVEAIRPQKTASRGVRMQDRSQVGSMTAEYDGTYDAEVGYVAWGSAQGVVRDAVTLCRSFGLNVAALYPKAVLPFPVKELESFERTVKRVVIVESGQTSRLADRVRASCSFRTTIVSPEPGHVLTPMDIFLREGLGAC
jgi:Pyruvate/2-oxoacid:ferredoxin oxidoreductase gamma subunit